MDEIPIEPRSDFRQGAKGVMEMFVALKNEGFTESQALYIIGTMLSAALGRGKGSGT